MQSTENKDMMHQIASAVVRWRFVIMLLFLAAAVYCALSIGKVQGSSDLTMFLGPETETRRGLTIMEEEFISYASENIMVANVTCERAEALADEIRELDGVADVSFDNTPAHYNRAAALLSVSYAGPSADPAVSAAKEQIRAILAPYDSYSYNMDVKNYFAKLAGEMAGVLLIAVTAAGIWGIKRFLRKKKAKAAPQG